MFRSVFFTNRKQISDFEKTIKNLPRDSTIIIREYDLPKVEREEFARRICALARIYRCQVLVGKDLDLARKIKADGIHFSDFDKLPISILRQRNFIFSYACHSEKSLLRVQKLKPEMVFISPIFPTKTHPEIIARGIFYLAKIVTKYRNSLPIYALGGVNSSNLKLLKKLNLSGFGAINFFQTKL